jgi:IS30 family transposase
VPALDRLAVRQVSARFLSQDGRIEIADLRHPGLSIRQIPGRQAGTIDDLASATPQRRRKQGLSAFDAHRRATGRQARSRPRRIETSGEPRQLVAELLAQRWRSQQISRHIRPTFPEAPEVRMCHESIYQAAGPPESPLFRPSPLAPR